MNIIKTFNKLSNYGKILVFLSLFLVLILIFKMPKREGYEQLEKYVMKKGDDIYDDFYSEIYDLLVYNDLKNDYEITKIVDKTNVSNDSVFLDVGSGTGHHVKLLSDKGLKVTGIDKSAAMVKKAKANFPDCKFVNGDVLNTDEFNYGSFTHMTCMYFSIYYLHDRHQFFDNCMAWLKPGGFLVVHLVNPEKFDPILPPGNPLQIVSAQKYAKERITSTKITFNEFVYTSNFDLKKSDKAIFEEKFKFNNGKVRKQEQVLHMDDLEVIVNEAKDAGFVLRDKINLVHCAYEYQYLYIFARE
jgi:SAM-dependent methyltransferase